VLAAAIAADRRGFFVEPQTVKDQTNDIELEDIELVWQTGKFQRSLEDRGIASTKNPNLTLRQETFLQAYLNPLNLKPPQTVAKQMKISTIELDGWMRQKHFAEAMSAKSEENLRKYIPMADQALGQLVQQGDMKAITFVNQLTGRFDANAKSQVDVSALLLAMQEIIQKHVRDPITRRNIARELISLAQGNSSSTVIPEPMPDAIMSEETTVEINTKD
jgi:7-keto-8-aminopelargonate synthetase-like enzyme